MGSVQVTVSRGNTSESIGMQLNPISSLIHHMATAVGQLATATRTGRRPRNRSAGPICLLPRPADSAVLVHSLAINSGVTASSYARSCGIIAFKSFEPAGQSRWGHSDLVDASSPPSSSHTPHWRARGSRACHAERDPVHNDTPTRPDSRHTEPDSIPQADERHL